MSPAEQLEQGIAALGLGVDRATQQRLLDYTALIDKWNQVYNLTAIREPEKMISHHLLDCLAVLPHIAPKRLLDVGSGAGLPGIPLALALPGTHVTVLDSNHKKAAFLRQAVLELGLKNVEVCSERVESWKPEQQFDVIISRAFSDLAEFVRLTRHLIAPGGAFAAMKGLNPHEEIEKLPEGSQAPRVLPLAVPGLDAGRHLILVKVG
jgi:16S rRNA (guanine527-N7)-methyltransferase